MTIYRIKRKIETAILAAVMLLGLGMNNAQAVQFSYLDPGYTQDIFTGPLDPTNSWGPGFSWSPAGNLILRSDGNMYEYALADDTIVNGTNVRSYTTHAVTGLSFGYGTTNGTDGYVYANSNIGLQQVDITTWTATTLPGTASGYYGISTLPDGRIVYSDGGNVFVYDVGAGTNTFIYNSALFIDDLAVAPTGEIFLAVLGAPGVDVIDSTGALINTFGVVHPADGIAFGGGSAYGNNTDGTITRYDFAGPNFTGAVTETVIASGSGAYGDLASVGPDGQFYVSQWGQANWDDGTSTFENIVVAIGPKGKFDPSPGVVPEPATLALLAAGLAGLGFSRRKKSA